MPSIRIERNTKLQGSDSFQRLTKLLDQDKELRRLDPKYVCDFDSAQMKGTAKSKLFTAKLLVLNVDAGSGAGSKVELVVDLPFHLALMKGMIQKTLEKKLDEALGSPA
jgi:hypothetical protein